MTAASHRADPEGPDAPPPLDPRRASAGRARGLLIAGIAGGPLFLASAVLQGTLREGFAFSDHPPSALASGDLGWIQTATFILAGLLIVAGGAGLRIALHGPGGVWGPRLIGAFGVALVAGGLFPMDPAFGFPPGAPPGVPEAVSWHGLVHGAVFAVGFLALVAACVVFARRYRLDGSPGMRWVSLACGGSSLALAGAPNVGDPEGRFLLLWFAVGVSLTWTTLIIADVGRRIAVFTPTPTPQGRARR